MESWQRDASVLAPSGANVCQSVRHVVATLLLLVTSCFLQGCDVTAHTAAAWETKPNYMTEFTYTPPGNSTSMINSCNLIALPSTMKCSGRGTCQQWNATSSLGLGQKTYFCLCDKYWADPECRTRRKSQQTAFLLAFLGGFFGLDHFYLGETYMALAKISTLGGCGLWWIYDIVRIGSGPVYAGNFRLANDFSHPVFLLTTVTAFVLIGYFLFGWLASIDKGMKRKKALFEKAEAMFSVSRSGTVDLPPGDPEDEKQEVKRFISLTPYYGATWRQQQATVAYPGSPQLPAHVPGGPHRNLYHYQIHGGMQAAGSLLLNPQPQPAFAAKQQPPTITPWLPPWETPAKPAPKWQQYGPYVPPGYEAQLRAQMMQDARQVERRRQQDRELQEEAERQDQFDEMERTEMKGPDSRDRDYAWVYLPPKAGASTQLTKPARRGALEIHVASAAGLAVGDTISIRTPGGPNELNMITELGVIKLQTPLSNSYPAGTIVAKAFNSKQQVSVEYDGKLYESSFNWQEGSGAYRIQYADNSYADVPANPLHAQHAFMPFMPGQSVFAERDGRVETGVVERHNSNRTYTVKYDVDGAYEDVPIMYLQPRHAHIPFMPGQKVLILRGESWCSARVQRQNVNGTCTVKYDDTAVCEEVPIDRLRADSAERYSSGNEQPGQSISVQSENEGGIYTAQVAGVNPGGTYNVLAPIRGGRTIRTEAHAPYQPGHFVFAERDGKIHSARVLQQNMNGTVQIMYDVDGTWENVQAHRLQDNVPFAAGQHVSVDRDGKLLNAVIKQDNMTGTYKVQYDEDHTFEDVPVHRLYEQPASTKRHGRFQFQSGMEVMVEYRGDMWGATIVQENDNGSFTVKYHGDGSYEEVTVDRLQTPEQASVTYMLGQKVQANRGGRWLEGRILQHNPDGTYQVIFDTPESDQYKYEDVPVTKLRPLEQHTLL